MPSKDALEIEVPLKSYTFTCFLNTIIQNDIAPEVTVVKFDQKEINSHNVQNVNSVLKAYFQVAADNILKALLIYRPSLILRILSLHI